jgi:hypothetical protein
MKVNKNILSLAFFLSALSVLISTNVDAEMTGTWQHEWAQTTTFSEHKAQKFESVIEPEWQDSIADSDWTARFRIRLDNETKLGSFDERPNNYSSINGSVVSNVHADLGIRELFFDGERYDQESLPDMEWRIGKQQVVWGQADGLKVLDIVNPQSFREFILDQFEDSRIPLWMVNLTFIVGDSSTLQLLWIPDTTYHELAESGSLYEVTSPERTPFIKPAPSQNVFLKEADKPSKAFKDSDIGFRYKVFWNGWDVTFNYLHYYQDLPVFYQENTSDAIIIKPVYERSHLIGSSLSNVFGDVTLRAEIGYQTDTFHSASTSKSGGINHHQELSSVIGLDWQGFDETFISLQWFRSQLFSYLNSTIRAETDQTISFLVRKHFDNQTWKAEILSLHSLNHDDGLIRPKAAYFWLSNVEVWAGADLFYGEKTGLYGQFDRNDRVVFGFEWGF